MIRITNSPTRIDRSKYSFRTKMVPLKSYDGHAFSFPCIVLYENATAIPVAYTHFEAFIIVLNRAEVLKGTTLKKRALNVCTFLNYVLHETNINNLAECDIDVIRAFLIDFQKTSKGYKRSETYTTCRRHVFEFLMNYQKAYPRVLFNFRPGDLVSITVVKATNRKGLVKSIDYSNLYVPRNANTQRKNRILLPHYLPLLLSSAYKYDPILVLPIMLQAYAGLREGEVVNVRREGIRVEKTAFGIEKRITIDLTRNADFWEEHRRKTSPGSIKKPRKQMVYYDFLAEFTKAWNEHCVRLEQYEKIHAIPYNGNGPILYNEYGRPMTVQSYSAKLRHLFETKFIKMLEERARYDGSVDDLEWANQYRGEYPGAHMLRHWFTMYLLTKPTSGGRYLTKAEIAKWRGDKSELSMETYINLYGDLVERFRDAMMDFQEGIEL